MSRFRRLPSVSLGFILVAGLLAPGCTDDAPPRPNFVLVTVDALAADRLGCFGGSEDLGKSLCRLGQQGTLFAWATTPGRGLASSAASALTGLTASAHRVDDRGLSFLPDARESIAERFELEGYVTAAFVTSRVLGRARRLDQGFMLYDDQPDTDVELDARVQRWIAGTTAPYFLWIHLSSETDLADLDRLVARLDGHLAGGEAASGVLFAALSGASPREPGIGVASHRVPMIWRAPPQSRGEGRSVVSFEPASLLDIAPTLAASAGLRMPDSTSTSIATPLSASTRGGRPLGTAKLQPEPRYLLLEDTHDRAEVGLVSGPYLYVRSTSPFDGSGQPVPTPALEERGARFLKMSPAAPQDGNSAHILVDPWRRDVLSADSPVPQLEFHLARRLRERDEGASH